MIFVLTFLNFAFGTHSKGICLDSRHLVLGLRVQSTSVTNVLYIVIICRSFNGNITALRVINYI